MIRARGFRVGPFDSTRLKRDLKHGFVLGRAMALQSISD